jgi:hypothetical protein
LQQNHQILSLTTLTKYVKELQDYSECFDEITDALLTVFLWRGHFPLKLSCFRLSWTLWLPLHSAIAFSWGIIIARDFEMIFSFLCFSIAWVLLAALEFRRKNPNPWKQPRTYRELLWILIFNKSFKRVMVEPNENIDDIIKYDEYLEKRERMRKDAIESMRAEREINERRLQKEGEGMADHALGPVNKVAGGFSEWTLSPFRSVLMPAQIALYKTCLWLRIAANIIMWNDSIAAFWIVTLSLFFSFVLAWIPWAFLFRWSFKIFVYVILGPWMKLVDIFYVHKLQNMTPEERKAQLEADYQRRYELLLGESYLRKLLKESYLKMDDMCKYMFGKVSLFGGEEGNTAFKSFF